jgi:hypothetical protein
MPTTLIIDSEIAARDMPSLFGNQWNWPITQSQYDQPITDFIEWSDELHNEISNSEQLLAAYFLCKSALLNDLSYLSAALLDISISRQGGLVPEYGEDKYLYRMIDEDSYPRVVPAELQVTPQSLGIQANLMAWARRYARGISDRRALRSTSVPNYSIGLNPLTREIAPATAQRIRRTHADVIRGRSNQSIPERVTDLAALISTKFCEFLAPVAGTVSPNYKAYIQWLVNEHLAYGWLDAGTADSFSESTNPSESRLFTGTGGGYAARLTAYQFVRSGRQVIRTTHGGDTPMFNDVVWPSTEFPFASTYVAYGEHGARNLAATIANRSESSTQIYANKVVGAGSKYHQSIRDSATAIPISGQPIRNVSVITGSFTGMYPVIPHMKLHDVVYLEWHRRLLASITNLGYMAVSKRHPKGLLANKRLFSDVAYDELLDTPMSAVEHSADAYVIDFPASAFMEALCTLKPVVVIDVSSRRMLPLARTELANSVSFVSASFDERNRVVIDDSELREAIEKPVNIDAREQLIQDYLLRPSDDFRSIYD